MCRRDIDCIDLGCTRDRKSLGARRTRCRDRNRSRQPSKLYREHIVGQLAVECRSAGTGTVHVERVNRTAAKQQHFELLAGGARSAQREVVRTFAAVQRQHFNPSQLDDRPAAGDRARVVRRLNNERFCSSGCSQRCGIGISDLSADQFNDFAVGQIVCHRQPRIEIHSRGVCRERINQRRADDNQSINCRADSV